MSTEETNNAALSHEESNRIYEAEVARELRRRRRLMSVYIVALAIPLVAAGISLVYNKSDREQSNRHLVSLVHEQVNASLPRAIDSTYSTFAPQFGRVITHEVASEVERQTASKFKDFSERHDPKIQGVRRLPSGSDWEFVAMARPDQTREDSVSSVDIFDRMELAKLSEQMSVLEKRQENIEYRLGRLSDRTLTATQRDSLYIGFLREELHSLTPKRLRRQGREIKRMKRFPSKDSLLYKLRKSAK